MLVHQGMSTDRELARIYYTEALEQAAQDRADRRQGALQPGLAARLILLAAAVIGVGLLIWLVAGI